MSRKRQYKALEAERTNRDDRAVIGRAVSILVDCAIKRYYAEAQDKKLLVKSQAKV